MLWKWARESTGCNKLCHHFPHVSGCCCVHVYVLINENARVKDNTPSKLGGSLNLQNNVQVRSSVPKKSLKAIFSLSKNVVHLKTMVCIIFVDKKAIWGLYLIFAPSSLARQMLSLDVHFTFIDCLHRQTWQSCFPDDWQNQPRNGESALAPKWWFNVP